MCADADLLKLGAGASLLACLLGGGRETPRVAPEKYGDWEVCKFPFLYILSD
jgi:hypothetical protein